ncbi:His Kinase A (phospho-acceptor) domain-containing protein [Lachnospiraceae bacterium NE2001]|nr:His Kinase A (phospho-acceptor) domain-containing protein [Lachnospiraceae bacterium NE2001]
MTRSGKNLGLYIFVILTISFIIVFVCVLTALNRYIGTEAYRSIQNCEGFLRKRDSDSYMEYSEGKNLFRSYYFLLEFNSEEFQPDMEYGMENLVRSWCNENRNKTNKIYSVELEDRLFYIKQIREQDTNDRIAIYTDISSAKTMERIVMLLLLVVMIVCDAISTVLGFRMTKRIRDEQDKQKKFFENASHELKTPLMSIQGFSEGLQKGVIEPKHAYKVIQKEVRKMSQMVDEILLLSKYDRKSMKLNMEEISINELVGDALDAFYMEIQNKNLVVTTEIEDRFITVDIEQMQRAVSNVISNAIRYAQTRIYIGCTGDTIVIWNDGMHLSEEDRSKMFDRFYMGEGGSTGIGLSLAKEIIDHHGFSIKAENYNEGVRFIIVLR